MLLTGDITLLKNSAVTRPTENLSFADVNLRSYFACNFLEIQSHLAKVNDLMREQTDVISVVEVFEERYRDISQFEFQFGRTTNFF